MRSGLRIFRWLAILLVACATPAVGKTWKILIGDDCPTAAIPCFDPPVLTINVGDSVIFQEYTDITYTGPHIIVADDGSFEVDAGPGIPIEFDVPGTVKYHESMEGVSGVIDVIAASAPTIDGAMTGAWFDSAQSGMGFIVEVLPGSPMQLLAAWLTFSPQGDPSWIVGLGPVQGDEAILPATQVVGSGARFPPSFDPTNVHTQSWGELTFTFSDCNHGHVDWSSTISGYGSAGMDLTRLTLPAGLTCPGGAIPQPDSGNRSP
jgi:hypothetical protein